MTSEEGWAAIQASGELRAMSRTHVHFATEPRHLRRNAWASVLLRLDVPAAMEVRAAGQGTRWLPKRCAQPVSPRALEPAQRKPGSCTPPCLPVSPAHCAAPWLSACLQAGHQFFTAANGVLLCPGPLPVRFVQRVERGTLPEGWHV